MAHHSPGPESDPELKALVDGAFRTKLNNVASELGEPLGPTGQFPEGKLTSHDEGEIRLAIGQKDGKVFVDFGSQVIWIGFTPAQAKEIARILVRNAEAIEFGFGKDQPPGKES